MPLPVITPQVLPSDTIGIPKAPQAQKTEAPASRNGEFHTGLNSGRPAKPKGPVKDVFGVAQTEPVL